MVSRFKMIGLLVAVLGCLVGLMKVQAQAPDGMAHHVAVVVQYGPGQVISRCVGFNEDTISGHDALIRAGFSIIAETSGSMGSLVCSIDGTGCNFPEEPCACQCQGGSCTYWAYSHLVDGVWRYSVQGASTYRVRDGSVEGWAWGGGSSGNGSTPPVTQWGDVCAAQAAPIEPTAVPPTALPPTTQPTAVPPTALPPTTVPTTNPIQATATRPANTATALLATPLPTNAPTQPIAPSAAPSPTATAPQPATATPSNDGRATASPAATRQPTTTVTPSPISTATVTATAPSAGGSPLTTRSPEESSSMPPWLPYGIAGIVVLGFVGAAWRRRAR